MTDYTDELFWDVQHWQGGGGRLYLRVGGWLTAIMIEVSEYTPEDLRFEVTDYNDVALFADLTVHSASGFHKGGKWFDPIPNVNTRSAYILKIPEDAPKLIITTVNRCLDWPR